MVVFAARFRLPDTPTRKVNTTDPDSRLLKAAGIGYVQGYNAQATVNEQQIVLAAEISVDSPDFGHLEPMVDATACELQRAGMTDSPQVVVADTGAHTRGRVSATASVRCECLRLNRRDVRSHAGAEARPGNGGRSRPSGCISAR